MFGIKTKVQQLLGITDLTNSQQALHKTAQEISWGQVFDFASRDSEWFKNRQLNPGRWAIGFPAFYVAFRVLNDMRPKNILEFGLGESTKMTLQYKNYFSDINLTVVEQNADWAKLFVEKYPSAQAHIKTLAVKQEQIKGHTVNVLEGLLPVIANKKYDFILIDGPIGSPHYSRHQLIDIIEHNLLDENFVILMDDANRTGEMETLAEAQALLKAKNIDYAHAVYSGEKDLFLLCSPGLQFLTTL